MHVGDTMSTSGDIMMHVGDTMSTSGGYHEYIGDVQYIGGYHDACGEQVDKVFQFLLKTPMY